jgi:hypothetical protein
VTGPDFSGVDIDLLADYVGGALTGTLDEARVAALVADDPAWRDAHALLAEGMTAVGHSLRTWGAEPEPMPGDVVARLDAALAEAGPVTPPAATTDTGRASHPVDAPSADRASAGRSATGAGVASGRRLSAVPDEGVDRATPQRARPRRRALRWAAPIAAAAGVLAFAGIGVSYLGGSSASDTTSSGGSAAMPQRLAALPAEGGITASGIDYGPSTIASGGVAPLSAQGGTPAPENPRPRKGDGPSPQVVSEKGLADGLARLRPRDALQACLDAIAVENGAGEITVQTVDYARFAGVPALVVRFTAGNGTWSWASGPDCGRPGVGAATRYSAR